MSRVRWLRLTLLLALMAGGALVLGLRGRLPDGTERCYNALRHARALLKREHGDSEVELRMFLLG